MDFEYTLEDYSIGSGASVSGVAYIELEPDHRANEHGDFYVETVGLIWEVFNRSTGRWDEKSTSLSRKSQGWELQLFNQIEGALQEDDHLIELAYEQWLRIAD